MGECLTALFPKDRMKKGDKIDVFIDGAYNRTATITGIKASEIIIYEAFPLPLSYRGPFYATGIDQSSGSTLTYVKSRKNFKYVRAAEYIRKNFAILDDAENLIPDVQEEQTDGQAKPVTKKDTQSESDTEGEAEDEV